MYNSLSSSKLYEDKLEYCEIRYQWGSTTFESFDGDEILMSQKYGYVS